MEVVGSREIEHTEQSANEPCKEDRMNDLRRKCCKTACHLSRRSGVDVKEIHAKFKPQKQMTELELQSKLDQLVRESNKVNR